MPDQRTGLPTAERVRRPGVRPLWIVIVLLVVGAGALWLSSRLTWDWSRDVTPLRGTVVTTRSGSQVASALNPLAILALAAVAAVLAIGGWVRRVVGVLVGIVGLAAIWLGVDGVWRVFGTQPAGYPRSQVAGGHLLAIVAGLLIVAAAIQVVRYADVLPRLGGSYQAPGAPRKRRDPDAELWQALSDGEDPTARD